MPHDLRTLSRFEVASSLSGEGFISVRKLRGDEKIYTVKRKHDALQTHLLCFYGIQDTDFSNRMLLIHLWTFKQSTFFVQFIQDSSAELKQCFYVNAWVPIHARCAFLSRAFCAAARPFLARIARPFDNPGSFVCISIKQELNKTLLPILTLQVLMCVKKKLNRTGVFLKNVSFWSLQEFC